MITIREYLESGTKKGYRLARKMLIARYGKTPLCRVELMKKKKNNKTYIWMKCTWFNKWYPINKFRELCLECQNEMVAIVMNEEL